MTITVTLSVKIPSLILNKIGSYFIVIRVRKEGKLFPGTIPVHSGVALDCKEKNFEKSFEFNLSFPKHIWKKITQMNSEDSESSSLNNRFDSLSLDDVTIVDDVSFSSISLFFQIFEIDTTESNPSANCISDIEYSLKPVLAILSNGLSVSEKLWLCEKSKDKCEEKLDCCIGNISMEIGLLDESGNTLSSFDSFNLTEFVTNRNRSSSVDHHNLLGLMDRTNEFVFEDFEEACNRLNIFLTKCKTKDICLKHFHTMMESWKLIKDSYEV